MNKFDVYERLWQEVKSEESFLPEGDYREEEYQLYKKLFKQHLREIVDSFHKNNKMYMSEK